MHCVDIGFAGELSCALRLCLVGLLSVRPPCAAQRRGCSFCSRAATVTIVNEAAKACFCLFHLTMVRWEKELPISPI